MLRDASTEALIARKPHTSSKRVYSGKDLESVWKNRVEVIFRAGSGVRARGAFGLWLTKIVQWGDQLAVPLVGDFAGDSREELVQVEMPANPDGLNVWRTLQYPYDPENAALVDSFSWGQYSDMSLVCTITNTAGGKSARAAYFRPQDGRFYVRTPEKTGGQVVTNAFGKPGDVPICMDVDQDGTDDFVVWRPSERRWYRNNSSTPTAVPTATEDTYAMGR